jgi:NADH dehydrogenase FAD-containing subunit
VPLPYARILNGFVNGGRIGVDEWLRVPSVQDVYAIGECSGFLESTGKEVLPALAQVVRLNHLANPSQ